MDTDGHQHVDPAFNSISYLYLLQIIYSQHTKKSELPQDLLECTVKYLLTFDHIQIRYAGLEFSQLLAMLEEHEIFPPTVTVEVLTGALLRLHPAGSLLTSHHLPLLKIAYHTDNVPSILPLITKNIVFYPGMRGPAETRPLCDKRLPPHSYISIESGLTTRLPAAYVQEYDLLCGLAHLSQRDYASASAAFERVFTFPSRDMGCSKAMSIAYNKWILVGLFLEGKLRTTPASVNSAVAKNLATLGRPYAGLAKAFEKPASENGAVEVKVEYDAQPPSFWAEEQNAGLVTEVLLHYERHHVLRLREIYSKIGLEDIRLLIHSVQAGGPLADAGQVEVLVRDMISNGILRGEITKPAGSAPGDGQGYLAFLPDETEDLAETQFAAEMAATAARLAALEPVLKATNERLGTSRDYVRHLIKEQKSAKEAAAAGGAGGGGSSSQSAMNKDDFGFDSQIEDEDLMTGVLAGN